MHTDLDERKYGKTVPTDMPELIQVHVILLKSGCLNLAATIVVQFEHKMDDMLKSVICIYGITREVLDASITLGQSRPWMYVRI